MSNMTEINEHENKSGEVVVVEYIRSNPKQPKDPLYLKKYYQENLKGVKHHCDICNKDIAKDKKARHATTKAHMRQLKEQLLEKLYENYSEFD